MVGGAQALGLVVGTLADLCLGDPRRGHPVALFGSVASRLEQRTYADSRAAGVAHTGLLVGGTVLSAEVARMVLRSGRCGGPKWRFWSETALVAASTYVVLGGTSLVREGEAMAGLLEEGDVPGARRRLGHLCARDATDLQPADLARATVESVAENTSDAVVAPLFWGAVAGVPGLLGYRAANTLDAMVGYRSPRYARFGWAAARLDDLLNLLPARLAALLVFVVTGRRDALATWRRDARLHPSPNAGPVEASYAGALGVRLGGSNSYGGAVEARGVLGDGRDVAVGDVARASALSRRVSVAALVACATVALVAGGRR